MKKLFWQVLLGLAFFAGVAQAQTTPPVPATICFISAKKILAAHPQGAKVLEAQQKAQAELQELSDKVQALQTKIANNTATPTERQQYETLVKTGQARQAALKTQIDKLLEPITKAVDLAVTKVALIRGCSVVLDRVIAAQSGLVIYVNPNTVLDISDDVILEITKPA